MPPPGNLFADWVDEIPPRPTEKIRNLRHLTPNTFYYSDTIRVLVGNNEEEFCVHREAICKTSDFFKAAMRNDCEESRTKIVKLPDEDPEIFKIYVAYFYRGRIYTVKKGGSSEEETRTLALAYVLGERVQDSNFKDAITDSLTEVLREGGKFHIDVIRIIYSGTGPTSTLRQFIIDRFLHSGSEKWLKGFEDRVPKEFLFDLSVAFLKFRPPHPLGTADALPDGCWYHEHGRENKPCYKADY